MTLATCAARFVFDPQEFDFSVATRPAYGTAGYLQADAEQVSPFGATRQLCWSHDHVNVWFENIDDQGNLTVELVRGWVFAVRKLVTAEVEHFDTRVIWAELPEGSPVGLSGDGLAIYVLPFDL